MKASTILSFILLSVVIGCQSNKTSEAALTGEKIIARPSDVQYKWHEQERIMFVHMTPGTWNGSEGDSPALPLNRFNPSKLNTDQWCEVALSWGAKEILFVAKHVGGFCWWQTASNYSIKNTPYKNGKGDVLSDLSKSCKKYGLNLGVYIYPGDLEWGAAVGSGGQTSDPSKQKAYKQVFRDQLTEVLTKYGDIQELWFDGSCKIEVGDIIDKYASKSVIFQGSHASIRWPGTESGKLVYPAWNSIDCELLKTGVSTQLQSSSNGNCWAPLEADTPLYEHFWLWSPEKIKLRKSIETLMECYYKSAGYGGVFLLNSTPDTTGLIPMSDVEHYKKLGAEIDRRFKQPLQSIENQQGTKTKIRFSSPTVINHVVTMEDYRQGERIRLYIIKGLVGDKWIELAKGQSVGRKKIDYFDDISVTEVELNVTESLGTPLIRSMSAYFVNEFKTFKKDSLNVWSATTNIMEFKKDMFQSGKTTMKIDLSKLINLPGQYMVNVISGDSTVQIKLMYAEIYFDGLKAPPEFVRIAGQSIHVNRTAIVTNTGSSVLSFSIESKIPVNGKVTFGSAFIY